LPAGTAFIWISSRVPVLGLTVELVFLVVVTIFALTVTSHFLTTEPVAGLVPAKLTVGLTLEVLIQPLTVLASPAEQAILSPPLVPLLVAPAHTFPLSKLGPQYFILAVGEVPS